MGNLESDNKKKEEVKYVLFHSLNPTLFHGGSFMCSFFKLKLVAFVLPYLLRIFEKKLESIESSLFADFCI